MTLQSYNNLAIAFKKNEKTHNAGAHGRMVAVEERMAKSIWKPCCQCTELSYVPGTGKLQVTVAV